MPVVRSSGEGGSHWNLEPIVIQVDSVLPTDGWRPVRRTQNSRKKAQKTQKTCLDHFCAFCAFLWLIIFFRYGTGT
jgi:hypothetical protein